MTNLTEDKTLTLNTQTLDPQTLDPQTLDPQTLDTNDIPGVMNWLSSRQESALPLNDDPMLRYCLQLEERILWQSREIESLRQLLNSEHGRNAGDSMTKPAGNLLARLRGLAFGSQRT